MVTLEELLKLPAFEGAIIVAGKKGLSRQVTWVHNVGVPDAAHWLNGGELALTTAINMPAEPDRQKHYLLELVAKGVAGLAVAVGRYIDTIPEYLLEIADKHNFPLVEIPYQRRFVDLAREANERIAQENMAMVTRALHIHQTLTRLILEGGGIKQLAATMTGLINQSVSIENERFEALASVNIGAVDEARRYTQQYGRTDPRLVAALEDEVLPEIRRTLRPVFIPQMPHVGLEMERILAPIVVHGEIYGYLWIIADDRPLTDLEHLAIDSGATIAALMLLHQESIQSAEASLKGNLLTRLVQGDPSRAEVLTDQALRYGVDLRAPFRVLLVEIKDPSSSRLTDLYRHVNRLVSAREYPAIAGQFAGQVMLLAQSSDTRATSGINALATSIHNGGSDDNLRIGISALHKGAEHVTFAHAQCREVLHIYGRMGKSPRTVYFDDLGYLHALYHAGPAALAGNPYVPGLRTLLDEQQQADLFHTLEAYLDAGGNGVATAEALHVHRSTLNYRLARIAEVCQVDLSNPGTRTNLLVALKLMRLFEVG